MSSRKKKILAVVILLVACGGALFLLYSRYFQKLISGYPPPIEDPDWLPSPLVGHSSRSLWIFSQIDEETNYHQIYLFQGELSSFDPERAVRLTSSEGDKSGAVWGADSDDERCTGPSFFYQKDDVTQREPTLLPYSACIPEESLAEEPTLGFDRPLTEEEENREDLPVENIEAEGLELGALSQVPNLETVKFALATKSDSRTAFVALRACDKLLLLPLPGGFTGKKPITWGGASRSGQFFETIVEADENGEHQLVYFKKEIAECPPVVDEEARVSPTPQPEEWDQETNLTCGGDNRNATLILPTRDRPDPSLHFFKVDLSNETAVSSLLNLKERIGKPCECAVNEDCDDGSPCTVDECRDHVCIYAQSDDPNCCNTEEECQYGQLCINHQCVDQSKPATEEDEGKKEKKPPTEPDSKKEGACLSDADCAQQGNGNLCNGILYCNKSSPKQSEWVCTVNQKSVVSCGADNDTPCSKNICDPKTGKCHMSPTPDGTDCEDGESCTKKDQCTAGKCVPGSWDYADSACQCQNDADCLKYDDENACTGTWYCLLATNKCLPNPATIVNCPSADDTKCAQNLCNPKTGKCEMTPSAEGLACDDGNACTVADSCQGGKCVPGKNNCECTSDTDCKGKNKGNLCLGEYYCDKENGACVLNPATVPDCSPENDTACMMNSCNPKTGKCVMVPKSDGLSCDADGQNCTPNDACKGGECIADEWDYSLSWCECQNNADCAQKEDNNLCNGTLYCDKTGGSHQCKVNPATIVTWCKEVTPCNPVTGKCKAPTSP